MNLKSSSPNGADSLSSMEYTPLEFPLPPVILPPFGACDSTVKLRTLRPSAASNTFDDTALWRRLYNPLENQPPYTHASLLRYALNASRASSLPGATICFPPYSSPQRAPVRVLKVAEKLLPLTVTVLSVLSDTSPHRAATPSLADDAAATGSCSDIWM